jgi:hypothetical protein
LASPFSKASVNACAFLISAAWLARGSSARMLEVQRDGRAADRNRKINERLFIVHGFCSFFWRWNESRRTLPDLASYHLQRQMDLKFHTLRKSYHSPLRFLLDLSLIGVTQLPIVGPQREWPKTCRALRTSINPLLSLGILVFPFAENALKILPTEFFHPESEMWD